MPIEVRPAAEVTYEEFISFEARGVPLILQGGARMLAQVTKKNNRAFFAPFFASEPRVNTLPSGQTLTGHDHSSGTLSLSLAG